MATILQFPTAYARVSALPAVRALRERLKPIAELAERLGPLSTAERAGVKAVALALAAGQSQDFDMDNLRKFFDFDAADVDPATMKLWLAAVGRMSR